MYLENLVFDATDPQRLGRFWSKALGLIPLTAEPRIFEARLQVKDGPALDLCFQPVPGQPNEPSRLHLDLNGAELPHVDGVADPVESLLRAGARPCDIGQGEVEWTVLQDPEANPFCVLEERPEYAGSGPLAALPLHAHDLDLTAEFWRRLTGWVDTPSRAPRALRHGSGTGPVLEFVPELTRKPAHAKNQIHVDLRLEDGDDMNAAAALIDALGGQEYDGGWGELPWRTFKDPSGNEVCVLPKPES
ncbi:MAG: VOC family protein [Galactobacter sp.]